MSLPAEREGSEAAEVVESVQLGEQKVCNVFFKKTRSRRTGRKRQAKSSSEGKCID